MIDAQGGPSGNDLPRILVTPPGPQSRRLAEALRAVESRNVTYVGARWPVFLQRGTGANLVDVDGNVYIDLCAGFAVAAVGHSNPRVVAAFGAQAQTLLHGMGDVHPNERKIALARRLCELAPGDCEKRVIFATTGSEAVEAALKTAMIATGKPGVLSFSGAYHGLTYGTLALTDRALFRQPFQAQLPAFGTRAPYPNCHRCPAARACPPCTLDCFALVARALDEHTGPPIGAVIVESIQGRGGEIPAPAVWLQALRRLCDERHLLLIADEVYTGFGRTGRWFACEHAGVVPDLICAGKGMSSGYPIAACIGKASVMDCWPESSGEAIHTSTFMGNPSGCAAALAAIQELEERGLIERAARLEEPLHQMLRALQRRCGGRISDVRGRGLMWGLECATADGRPSASLAAEALTCVLADGVIAVASGSEANVISLSPPLTISRAQLQFAVEALTRAIREAI